MKNNVIDEYLKQYNDEVKTILENIRNIIHELVPNIKEKISYGIPTFYLKKNIIHFAAYKNHIGIYPGADAIEHFKNELKEYETSKGTIRFTLKAPIPYNLIKEIIIYNISNID